MEESENELPELDSHWNFRVLRKERENAGVKWVTFCVHEVYYTDSKPTMCSEDEMAPHGETLDELKEDMERFQQAFTKPVLNYEDF